MWTVTKDKKRNKKRRKEENLCVTDWRKLIAPQWGLGIECLWIYGLRDAVDAAGRDTDFNHVDQKLLIPDTILCLGNVLKSTHD